MSGSELLIAATAFLCGVLVGGLAVLVPALWPRKP